MVNGVATDKRYALTRLKSLEAGDTFSDHPRTEITARELYRRPENQGVSDYEVTQWQRSLSGPRQIVQEAEHVRGDSQGGKHGVDNEQRNTSI